MTEPLADFVHAMTMFSRSKKLMKKYLSEDLIRQAESELQYIHRLRKLRCLPELLPWFVSSDDPWKELTETIGAIQGALKHLGTQFKDHTTQVIIPGDGTYPRTGVYCAYTTSWNVHSVDPALRVDLSSCPELPRRLTLYRSMLDTWIQGPGKEILESSDLKIVLAVHNHAPLELLWETLKGPALVLACPCCVPQLPEVAPSKTYVDPGILSIHNTVKIWEHYERFSD